MLQKHSSFTANPTGLSPTDKSMKTAGFFIGAPGDTLTTSAIKIASASGILVAEALEPAIKSLPALGPPVRKAVPVPSIVNGGSSLTTCIAFIASPLGIFQTPVLLMHGPADVLKDTLPLSSIQELIKDIPERVYPVGRLDYDTEGLLILTNDGELGNRIIHPRYKLPKVYVATVEKRVKEETLEKMIRGARLGDGFVKPDYVKIVNYEEENTIFFNCSDSVKRRAKRLCCETVY